MYSLRSYTIFLFLSCSLSSIHLCGSDSRLVPGKPLSPGSTLVSDDGTFTLGFFSPSKSKKHYYVGIWYNNIPQHTVVWVANRATPITNPSSVVLGLTSSSNIALYDANGHVIWMAMNGSINISSSPANTVSAEATLDGTGNFILRSLANSAILWQSFDFPTDTLLPGMNLRLSHKTHPLQRLTSWKDAQDPSPGAFFYGADPNSLLQRFIWHGLRPHRRSPVWNNYLLLGNYMDKLNSTIYMAINHAGEEVYMSFGMPTGPSSVLIRMKMDYSGKVNILGWQSKASVWTALYTEPAHECNLYGYCGPYAYCDNTESVPTCKCLDGFEPRDDKGWVSGKFSQGCHRREVLRSSPGNGFLTFPGMKVPDKFIYVRNRSFDECTEECRSNCSCVAYAYSTMNTMAFFGDNTRCLVWMEQLIDMEKIAQGGEILYFRVNKIKGNKRKVTILKIVLPIVACFVILICVLIWLCGIRGKQGSDGIWSGLILGAIRTSNELSNRNEEFPFFTFREIASATNNFSDSNILGRGGFGNVYKGTLEGDKEIAVKRLCKGSGQGGEEFTNEVVLIAKLQHRNLVKLIGCCIHEEEKLLIYEYLPNKSLDAFLFNDARKSVLDWPTRFKIIKGVARGLLYLHQDSRLTIVHRDLKASNILLDAEMRAKISDFGTARIFGGNEQQESTNRIVGTFGYMSPEYALEGIISVKSDVYSFGVLLMEIVSGLKISGAIGPIAGSSNLIGYAWSLWKDGNIRDLVDSSIVESCSLDKALRCIHIGLLSVQDNPNARPLMSVVVSSLDNESIELPQPKEPVYFSYRNYGTDKASESFVNDMNFSMEGR